MTVVSIHSYCRRLCWSRATDSLSAATRCCTSGDWACTIAGASINVMLQAATRRNFKLVIGRLLCGVNSDSSLNLFDRVSARIHASRESSLEGIHLLVVCGFGLIRLLLRFCTRRLSRLFLGLLVRRASA